MPLHLKPLLKQLTIKTKSLETRKFDLDFVHPVEGDFGWAQRQYVAQIEKQYNAGKPVRNIVLKARQLGISTATEGVMFWWPFLHPGTNGLILTHENPQSLELFEMTKLFWDTFPFKELFTLKYATKQHYHWLETRSRLRVGSAKNVGATRGSTFHAVHASEMAFYPNPETLMLGLNQTIPNKHGTFVTIESTANGVGNYFHEMWQEAEEGGNDYTPLFFPWYHHPEYRMATTLNIRSELDREERALLKLGASYENLAWRRWAIVNLAGGDLGNFMQEYPSTPEEAFLTSGRPIFSHIHVRQCFDEQRGHKGMLVEQPNGRMKFVHDNNGSLTIFKAPRRGDDRQDRYFISGDPSETVQGDPACIQVINRQTFEQVAVWHGRINPIHFAHEMIKVGKFYNGGMLCPEVEGGGQATVATLINLGYSSIWQHRQPDRVTQSFNTYGWSTNFSRKAWAIGTLQRLFVDGSILIHDRLTYNQLLNYVERDDGTWGNSNASVHDDSVMSLAIGVTASREEGPFMPDKETTGPVMDLYRQEFVEGVS